MTHDATTQVRQLLADARLEVIPAPTILDRVLEHVPTSVTVTVTASPTRSIEDTLDLATRLAAHGYDVVPHVAARMVRGRGELEGIVERLRAHGVRKVFVPAGDAQSPLGDYTGSLDLLRDLTALGDPFEEVGVAGYPESHPFLDDTTTARALADKVPHATLVVSNMTFDVAAVGSWLRELRGRGVDLPVRIGVPGPVERAKLLAMGLRIGVGESLRFLRKQRSVMTRIAAPGYDLDTFLDAVAVLAADDTLGVAGLHLYSFNQVEVVEAWRRGHLGVLAD